MTGRRTSPKEEVCGALLFTCSTNTLFRDKESDDGDYHSIITECQIHNSDILDPLLQNGQSSILGLFSYHYGSIPRLLSKIISL